MRGRLLNPFTITLAQINTAAMTFNDKLREPVISYNAQGQRDNGRRETTITFQAQVETNTYETQRQTDLGNAPATTIVLIAHFGLLEVAGLVDAQGRAKIRVNDRLVQITAPNGTVETQFPNPPGVYVQEVTPIGYGFGGRKNLLMIRAGDRPQGQVRQ